MVYTLLACVKFSALPLLFLLTMPLRAQPLVSPDVHADGRVTFRLRAPQAREVLLQCEGVPDAPMQRDAQGVWSATTAPLAPDIYDYSFRVDGLRAIDPANPFIQYNLLDLGSLVHVPGPADLPWEINAVPHGVIHRHLYRSAVIGRERPFLVYTPPGYDPAAAKPYPVLYLLHGYSDAEDAWTTVGRANVILDNLIARGQAKPMVVVMPLGYGNDEVLAAGWSKARTPQVKHDSDRKFGDALLNEVMSRACRWAAGSRWSSGSTPSTVLPGSAPSVPARSIPLSRRSTRPSASTPTRGSACFGSVVVAMTDSSSSTRT